jgi:hypothetical protein
VIVLQTDPRIQSRIDELAAKANEGLLSADERLEYQNFVEGIDLIAVARARTRAILRREPKTGEA